MSKVCPKCNKEKPLNEFGKKKQNKKGYSTYCLQCKREYNAWFRNTPAGIYQQIKGQINYTKKHKGQRDNKGFIRGIRKDILCTQDEFVKWYESQPKLCVYCGLREEELITSKDIFNKATVRLTVDCKDNDKGYSIDNMVLACNRCNFTKSDLFTFDEMLEIGKIIKRHRDNQTKI